jgi:GT2 family glycosyltransferase
VTSFTFKEQPHGLYRAAKNVFRKRAPRKTRTLTVAHLFACFIQLEDYNYLRRAAVVGLVLAGLAPRFVRYHRHSANLSSSLTSFAPTAESIPFFKLVLNTGGLSPYLLEPVAVPITLLTIVEKAFILLSHLRNEKHMFGFERLVELSEESPLLARAERFGSQLPPFLQDPL